MVEQEYKYLLSQTDFQHIYNMLSQNHQPTYLMNFNYYYDTSDFLLKRYGYTVRVRQTSGKRTLEIKCPSQTSGYKRVREEKSFPIEDLPQKLDVQNIVTSLPFTMTEQPELLGLLVTERTTFYIETGIKVDLDQSSYLGITDHELEIEYDSEKAYEADQWFHRLTDDLDIPVNRKGKRSRFITRFQSLYGKE
ncbi:CYTH domain-containing protein [Bacillus altitudinis]|uniref:CYTH domain-containing protein n=1 Tax=Bacillus altitudinis TaxID=293387 RepID=UPI0024064888|nr:CYTH domain-containing protein [Bacillus altitudinis]MDF9417164.1 CYTH domain-containing protein [Bacillus altitudinis]